MSLRTWINKTLTPQRVLQGCIVLLFSGIHFAACIAVGGLIAHQYESPNPETEARLYALESFLLHPLGDPLMKLDPGSTILFLFAGGLNSLLWGLAAFLICYAVVVGVRRLWRGLTGSTKTSA